MNNGIKEIIESGRAPGFQTGALDPQSVFVKAPKAFAEIERGERRSKRGISAGEISRYIGLPTDFIKKKWRETNPRAFGCFLALLWSIGGALGGELQPGQTFVDGQTVHASDLNNAIGNARILSSFMSDNGNTPINNSPLLSDYALTYSPTLNGLYKVTLRELVNNGQSFVQLPSGSPVYTNLDLFSFYSAAGTNIEGIVFSNLVLEIAVNINPVNYLDFVLTNANGVFTNLPILPNWAGAFSGSQTNNQPYSLWWGTNGVPVQQSLSNIEQNLAFDLGTNLSIPYEYRFVFQPWTLFGTNSTGFTNNWYGATNGPITAFIMPQTNAPALTDTDTLPINSQAQMTNTTASLLALYQYMTNKNALPPYTQARIQFSGYPASYKATNEFTIGNAFLPTNFVQAGISAVSFNFNGTAAATLLPTSPQVTSNTVYYITPTNAGSIWYYLYTNYTTAVAGGTASAVAFTGTAIANPGATMYFITNYTSLNADAIAVVTGSSLKDGVYDICFRTNAENSLYYVTGTTRGLDVANGYSFVTLTSDNLISTKFFEIGTWDANVTAFENTPLVEILVQPQ